MADRDDELVICSACVCVCVAGLHNLTVVCVCMLFW